ncbi:MAG: trypsin-like peptidase domain-containing protein [Bdellovibrionales bacterium]|nr:trypsin-like peptidase domain-containing protein [Bdellovibrionales bacterium]
MSGVGASADWAGVYQAVKPSIPMIMSSGGLCSGALIQDDIIVTAAHCVNRFRPVHVTWNDNPKIFENARVVRLNTKADVALIQLEKKSERKPLPLLAKGQKLPEGTAIATIGHPSIGEFLSTPPFDMDMTYLMSTGIVSGVTTDDFISDMSVSPGNSGGPVFNDRGDVVGVVSRKRIDRFVGSIGMSAGLNKVYELLENHNAHKGPEPTWRNASSSGKIYIAYSGQTFMGKYDGQNVWYAGFNIDIWDRLRFEFADNFSRTKRFQDYALGYKFATEMHNHNMIYITPTLDYLHYKIDENDQAIVDKRVVGYGVSLMASQIPFGLKYIGFNVDGHYYGVTSLQLAF